MPLRTPGGSAFCREKRKKRRKKGRDALKGWLERFKQWLLAEEYAKDKNEERVESEIYEEEYEESEPQVAPIPVANKHLTIRTANIYPKRTVERAVEQRKSSKSLGTRILREKKPATSPSVQRRKRKQNKDAFPFPLIPDEPPIQEYIRDQESRRQQEREEREAEERMRARVQETSQRSAYEKSRAVRQESTGQEIRMAGASRGGKRPFRPTEVISPIYGRKRPEQREQEEQTERIFSTLAHPMSFKETEAMATQSGRQAQGRKHAASASIQRQENVISGREERKRDEEEILSILAHTAAESRAAENKLGEVKREDKKEVEAAEVSLPSVEEEMEELPKELTFRSLPLSQPVFEEEKSLSSAETDAQMISFEKEIPGVKPVPVVTEIEPEKRTEWTGPSTAIPAPAVPSGKTYEKPAFSLLIPPPRVQIKDTEYIEKQREVLATTLHNFNVNAEVIGAVRGPTVTRYEIQPAPGVKVNKITNLIDDIKLSLAARDIRIEAPIPGRSAVGIEVPNEQSMPVFLRSILESKAFREAESPLTVALGMDIGGEPIVADLAKMPHGLIAGATGSGKSVCINSIILSLLYKATPEEVRLLLVDPKMVELAPYNRLPHLVAPVVTDPKQATAALKWAVQEMDSRYEKFAEAGARDITRYNDLMRRAYPGEKEYIMPSIVIIIDELADLMMVAPHDVEEAICRIAQKARACGIHLLVATQRPSVDVITGLIKANIPTRVAFSVSSQTDSRTILDMNGAERLLGRGDMLYLSSGSSKPIRLQGPYVSDDEIEAVTEYVRSQAEPNYLFEKEDLTQAMMSENTDELFAEVVLFCVENGQASASLLQRNFQIGYNRAARLIDMMEEKGFISGQTGSSKPRDVFLSRAEYDKLFRGEARRE